MANRDKGEIDLAIGEHRYTLVLTTNAMVQLEDLFSTPEREVTFQDILRRVNAGSIRYMRAFIWAALQQYHRDLTIEQVGELIQEAGGIIAFAAQITALGGQTVPGVDDLAALGVKPGRPQRAQAVRRGTGTGSTVTPDASV